MYKQKEDIMARMKGGVLRGKIGNLVYSGWKGIEIVKAVQDRKKNSWTEPQLLHRRRFKAISNYCGQYKYTLIPQIWNLAAENGHGRNLFLKANAPAFALDGELSAVEKLHFSAGELPFPQHITVKRQEKDPSQLEITWVNDQNLSPIYEDDELMMITGNPGHFTSPIASGVLRKTGKAVVDLPENQFEITGIWLFFRSARRNKYSWDKYFKI